MHGELWISRKLKSELMEMQFDCCFSPTPTPPAPPPRLPHEAASSRLTEDQGHYPWHVCHPRLPSVLFQGFKWLPLACTLAGGGGGVDRRLVTFGRLSSLWGDWEEGHGWGQRAGRQSESLKRHFSDWVAVGDFPEPKSTLGAHVTLLTSVWSFILGGFWCC